MAKSTWMTSWTSRRVAQKRGVILLEGVLTLTLVVGSMFLTFELARHSLFKLILQHAAFIGVRSEGIGFGTGKGEMNRYLRYVLGKKLGASVASGLTVDTDTDLATSIGDLGSRRHRVHLTFRYPQFMRFPFQGQEKHHFEVRQECILLTSYPFP